VPQDIPVEASELLSFTPASLKEIEGAPSFTLRASTTREKRFHRRLLLESGIRYHDNAAMRRETETGLKALWGKEQFEEFFPFVKSVWEARDDFEVQVKDDPNLKWEFDEATEAKVDEVIRKVTQQWQPLCVMIADNADYAEMSFPILNAVTIKSFTGLDVKRRIDRGYFTLETIEAIQEALSEFEKANGLPEGVAWMQLSIACSNRMYLKKEEAGNSELQSPLPTAPAPLNETNTSEPDGKSPARARSKKTPVTA
jgi:hypothetical protein